jgi:hypothetical protein
MRYIMHTNTSSEKPVGKRPLQGPRHRWEDNIKIYHEQAEKV